MLRLQLKHVIFLIAAAVFLCIVAICALTAATAAAYNGPGGCPANLPPRTAEYCAYHTYVHQISVFSYGPMHACFDGVCDFRCASSPDGRACTTWVTVPGYESGRLLVSNHSAYTRSPQTHEYGL